MLKEQVAEILLEHFNNGFVMGEIGVGDDQEATDKALEVILNLFKAEVDKLAVLSKYGDYRSVDYAIALDQLQDTKKQLLDLMGEV